MMGVPPGVPGVVRSQGHETPGSTHTPKPSVNRANKARKPERSKPDREQHPNLRRGGGGNAKNLRKGGKEGRRGRSQKSAPVQERTVPVGSGAWVSVESLGKLPINRRH